MIALFDVDYRGNSAHAACVLLEHWHSHKPYKVYTKFIEAVEAYESGSFYKRELPCLIALLQVVEEELEGLLIDGYVWAGDKPGLGYHLYVHCHKRLPVIGVAKNSLKNNMRCREVFRGKSKKPLYVSSAGMELEMAEVIVQRMPGPYRLPDMLKEVDTRCRQWVEEI